MPDMPGKCARPLPSSSHRRAKLASAGHHWRRFGRFGLHFTWHSWHTLGMLWFQQVRECGASLKFKDVHTWLKKRCVWWCGGLCPWAEAAMTSGALAVVCLLESDEEDMAMFRRRSAQKHHHNSSSSSPSHHHYSQHLYHHLRSTLRCFPSEVWNTWNTSRDDTSCIISINMCIN